MSDRLCPNLAPHEPHAWSGDTLEWCPGPAPHLSVQTLTREARKVMADLDLDLSQNRLVKIIRRYLREGRPDVDFRSWFIAYADPTGEKAVRNVMRASAHDGR